MSADPVKSESPHGAAETSGSLASGSAQNEQITELFTRYHAKLVKSLVARTRCWEEARDIASQAFMEVLSQRPGTVNFLGPYLYRTARNLVMNRVAHASMRKRKELLLTGEAETDSSPEPLWAEREQAAALRRAIDVLSPRLRMALILRIWDDLPYQEIVQRFAAAGVVLNVRTVQRYVGAALETCRRTILAAQDPTGKEAK